MSFIIENMTTGEQFNFTDYGLEVKEFRPSSPSLTHNFQSMESASGFFDLGSSYGERRIGMTCMFYPRNNGDHVLLQAEIFQLFHGLDKFKLIDERELGKYYIAKLSDSFSLPQRLVHFAEFEIEFVCQPYRLSTGTTQDPFTFEEGVWQFGQNLYEGMPEYTHTTTLFDIYNASVTKIDPRFDWLKITFEGASTNLQIKNLTTNETWSYTGTTTATDEIILEYVEMKKNGLNIIGSTNIGLITLAKGLNNFQVIGATGSFTISFEFRFKYI